MKTETLYVDKELKQQVIKKSKSGVHRFGLSRVVRILLVKWMREDFEIEENDWIDKSQSARINISIQPEMWQQAAEKAGEFGLRYIVYVLLNMWNTNKIRITVRDYHEQK